MATSVFLAFLAGLGVKLTPHIPIAEVLFCKSIITLTTSYTILRYRHVPVWGNTPKVLILRSVSGFTGLCLFFNSLHHMPLASAITIQYTSPIFITILSIFVVKEPVKPWQWVFFLTSFIGVVCIKGFDPNTPLLYVLMGLLAALCRAISHNFVRYMKGKEHPLVMMFYATLISTILTSVYLTCYFVMPTPYEWGMLAGMSIFSCLSHYCMIMAYQLAPVAQVTSINYLSVVCAFVVSYFFLQETVTPLALLGIALVLLGVILDLLYKQKTAAKTP